ncbi:MAG: succinylglutamate desuccinylase/aspartoacylase family protein [Bacteriovoracaceae bacterium]|nr:succinylglutamate desuccinylase/aspartoacylase family protein [Bacteriovoracaceae bacterium]
MNTNPHLPQLEKFFRLQKEFLTKSTHLGLKVRSPIENSLLLQTDDSGEIDLYFSAIIHGNEVIGLYLVNEILDQIYNKKITCQLNILITLGNLPAFLLNKRFHIKDMNRQFLSKSTNRSELLYSEQQRAWDMEKMITDFKIPPRAIFDIHQTTAASETPFLMVREHAATMKWWSELNTSWPLIYYPSNQIFSNEGASLSTLCSEYNIPDITLELGQAGYHYDLFMGAWKLIEQMLSLPKDYWRKTLASEKNFDLDYYLNLKKKNNKIYKELGIHQKKSTEHYLVENLKNFTFLPKGTPISSLEHEKILTKEDVFLLFPKYGDYQKTTNELCRFLSPMN